MTKLACLLYALIRRHSRRDTTIGPVIAVIAVDLNRATIRQSAQRAAAARIARRAAARQSDDTMPGPASFDEAWWRKQLGE